MGRRTTVRTGVDPDRVGDVFLGAWSSATSSVWSPQTPAKGQCSVTALVTHELFGGDIPKTQVAGEWHFYNRIEGRRRDDTALQFESPIEDQDLRKTVLDALTNTTIAQVKALREAVRALLDEMWGRQGDLPR